MTTNKFQLKKEIEMKLIRIILYIIELIGLTLFAGVNYFTNSKMGMMRHVMYKNEYFSQKIFTKNVIFALAIIFLVLFVLNIIILSKKKYGYLYDVILSEIIIIASILLLKFYNVDKLLTYYYLLIALCILMLCEFIKVILNAKFNKNSSS